MDKITTIWQTNRMLINYVALPEGTVVKYLKIYGTNLANVGLWFVAISEAVEHEIIRV